MYTTLSTRLDAIKALPLDKLTERQPMLVALIADIVNYETEDGEITMQAGNTALTRMDYWNTLCPALRDAGFKMLGHGHFSAAYEHALLPGKVIKVGFKKEDSGAAYVAFSRMHQGRRGIPTIYDVQRHLGCYTVVMDELLPLVNSSHDCVNDRHDYLWGLIESAVSSPDKYYNEVLQEYITVDFDGAPLSLEEGELLATCRDIYKFFTGIAAFDMHKGNAMIHPKTGEIIITDPVSFTQHGGPLEKCVDPINPDVLLADIEEAVRQALIKGAKRRKKLRNPQSTERKAKRLFCKAHRAHIKKIARRQKLKAIRDAGYREEQRRDARHVMLKGITANACLWFSTLGAARDLIAREMQKVDMSNNRRIAMGRPLVIDDVLNAFLLG